MAKTGASFKVILEAGNGMAIPEATEKTYARKLRDAIEAAGFINFTVVAPCGFEAGVHKVI